LIDFKCENKTTKEFFDKMYLELIGKLDPEEKNALNWFRRGLRAQDHQEKLTCYQKTREILGNFVLK